MELHKYSILKKIFPDFTYRETHTILFVSEVIKCNEDYTSIGGIRVRFDSVRRNAS